MRHPILSLFLALLPHAVAAQRTEVPQVQFTAPSELTPENEACVILSPGQYTALPANHFLKQKYPDLKSYARHRSRIEVVRYDGTNPRSARMTAPRNMTDQDQVYLHLTGDALQYNYQVSFTTSALAEREVANISGSPIGVASNSGFW